MYEPLKDGSDNIHSGTHKQGRAGHSATDLAHESISSPRTIRPIDLNAACNKRIIATCTELAADIDGIKCFAPRNIKPTFDLPERPLRIAILTSIRDVVKDEHVGNRVVINGQDRYMKGSVEELLEAVNDERLAGFVDVAAIITDDLDRDLTQVSTNPLPIKSIPWIHPYELTNGRGDKAVDITFNAPSLFRKLPKDDIDGRTLAKLEHEHRIVEIMRECNADIIVSDHYLNKIEHLIGDYFGLYGKVLNCHPGITRANNPYSCRGNLPYMLAIKHAQGFTYNEDSKEWAPIAPHFKTGATLHVMDQDYDTGQILCEAELTPVNPEDSILQVNWLNYRFSKNPVFIQGLKHYACHIFPLLSE